MSLRVAILILAMMGLLCAGGAQADASARDVVRVVVSGVKTPRGHVRVEICPPAMFLKDCPYSGSAPASVGATVVEIPGVPPGVYAAQAFQDDNDNHTVDRNVLGIPSEPVGFSNDAPIRLGPPSFRAASFTYKGGEMAISFRLRRFLQ